MNFLEQQQQQQQQQYRENGGGRLDLSQHRDQRGSAFELYKKPNDPRSPGHQLYMEHNARCVMNSESCQRFPFISRP